MKAFKVLLIPVFCLAFGACSHTPKGPEHVTYVEATKIPEPKREPVVMEVPKPLPLPGQLKKIPPTLNASDMEQEDQKPWEVIEKANKDASQNPSEFGYFNSIMQYDFAPGALYQIYCAPLKLTDIQLQSGEKILGKPACGDTVRWVMGIGKSKENGIEREHLYIKPTRSGLDTTLTINTNRRTYHIELHSYKATYMAGVSWRYPHDEIAMINNQAQAEEEKNSIVTSPLISIDSLNFAYKIEVEQGDRPIWFPVNCFDDGRKTFIQFPKAMLVHEAPVLFVLSKDSNETQLVNYRVKNEYYVVDRLVEKAELRLGQSEEQQTIVRITKIESRSMAEK
jgi:type IV secretion system protein VirB9